MPDELTKMPYYRYSNAVRGLFLTAAIITILTYPFFSPFLPQSPIFIMVAIVLLAVMAGLTNPRKRWATIVDIIISLCAIPLFETHALTFVRTPHVWIFLTDQVLVIIFVIALYYSVKNFREA
jgi:hypothetical protein